MELGIQFVTETPVAKINKVKEVARQVILNDGIFFEGDKIILDCGYESREIARTVGIDIPMTKYFEETL